MPKSITKENAQQIAVDYLKKKKNTDKIDVAAIDQHREDWVVRGTCPIDMEGHPWAEKFEVVVDTKGKIKNTHASLL
jgi:ActR/RegA family two-component response regulator